MKRNNSNNNQSFNAFEIKLYKEQSNTKLFNRMQNDISLNTERSIEKSIQTITIRERDRV